MPAAANMVGRRFGKLLVIKRGAPGRKVKWTCICDCGTERDFDAYCLSHGISRSCGCSRKISRGDRFGRLTAINENGIKYGTHAVWECKCECGNTTRVPADRLKSGNTSSCGCLRTDRLVMRNLTHGSSYRSEYRIWCGIIQRCENNHIPNYQSYGARGIRVCQRWRQGETDKSGFECFIEDIGPRPSQLHSIDRINNDGNYEPGNCRWATPKEQAQNRWNSKKNRAY